MGARDIVADSNLSTTRGTLETVPDDVTGDTGTAQKAHPKKANPFSARVRVIQLTFLTLAVVATICLAWWQWDRWSSGGGSFQNLGYAMQWPAFGIFFIVAYRKYMQYERERALGEEAPAVTKASAEDSPREIPQDVLDQLGTRRHGNDSPAGTTSATGGSGANAGTNHAFVDDRRRAARRAREANNTDTADNADRTGTTDPR